MHRGQKCSTAEGATINISLFVSFFLHYLSIGMTIGALLPTAVPHLIFALFFCFFLLTLRGTEKVLKNTQKALILHSEEIDHHKKEGRGESVSLSWQFFTTFISSHYPIFAYWCEG